MISFVIPNIGIFRSTIANRSHISRFSVPLGICYSHHEREDKINDNSLGQPKNDYEGRGIIRIHKLRMIAGKAVAGREDISFSGLPDGGECKSNDLRPKAVGVVQYPLLPSDKTLNEMRENGLKK